MPMADARYVTDENDLARHAKAFGAGFVDPFGATGYGLQGLSYALPQALSPQTAQSWAKQLQDWQAGSPVAATMGGMLIPGFAGGRLVGLTAREALAPQWLGPLMAMGGQLRSIYESDFKDKNVQQGVRNWWQDLKALPAAVRDHAAQQDVVRNQLGIDPRKYPELWDAIGRRGIPTLPDASY